MFDQPAHAMYTYQTKKTAAQTPRSFVASTPRRLTFSQKIGLALMLIALGGMLAAFYPILSLELGYRTQNFKNSTINWIVGVLAQESTSRVVFDKKSAPTIAYDPLKSPDGSKILPVNTDFAILIPKLNINSTVIAGVNPSQKAAYTEALKKGVAHSATSFYPNENGAVYLFSHSTNYEWFVKDLNAVFYLVKDLEPGDPIVVIYLGHRYTYEMRDKQIVAPTDLTYLQPIPNQKTLILQTCWPPGTVSKRLLIFADLVDERPYLPGN